MLDFSIEREHLMKYQELGGSQKWGENQSSFKIDSKPIVITNDYILSKSGWKLVVWELPKVSKC
jgi:hypothetical protein